MRLERVTIRDDVSGRTRGAAAELWLARAIVGWSALCYVAYAWAAIARLDLTYHPVKLALAVVVLAAVWLGGLRFPLGTALVVLTALPLFGNHPGGRLMDSINLPLAASAAGMAREARRLGRPAPSGLVAIAALLYLGSAAIAVVATLPDIAMRVVELNHWPTAIADALTSAEDVPLYAISSLVGLTLCVGWAAALAWRAPGVDFLKHAVRFVTAALIAVVVFGAIDYQHTLSTAYFLRIDPRPPDLAGLQSVFWNPGWFAWYFVMAFALALGALWSESRAGRVTIAIVLGICYACFFGSPQRGGLIAVHAILLAAAAVAFVTFGRRTVRYAVVLTIALGAAAAFLSWVGPHASSTSIFRLLAEPDAARASNAVRVKLWTVAWHMWRDAPMFGLGEGSFAWRFLEYANPSDSLYTPFHGDAHNTWLQILATRGLVGVIALLGLVAAMGHSLFTAVRRNVDARGPALGAMLALVGFLCYSAVQGMFYLQSIQVFFWFLVAVSAITAVTPRTPGRRFRVVAAGVMATALAAQIVFTLPAAARTRDALSRLPRGFYPPEDDASGQVWRWSVRGGTLCLQPTSPDVQVRLMIGDPRAATYPRLVTLDLDDAAVIDRVEIGGPGIVTRNLRLTRWPVSVHAGVPFGECAGGDVHLSVSVDRSWSPLAAGLPDPRTLGVAVFAPTYASSSVSFATFSRRSGFR